MPGGPSSLQYTAALCLPAGRHGVFPGPGAGGRADGGALFCAPGQPAAGRAPASGVCLRRGGSLLRWYTGNRFCGACGAENRHSEKERALVCPRCGRVLYPKICPAVIVAITDGDRLLLTKYAGRAYKRYALVAGFNEIGESIEATVHREVLEETGLRVKNLRFYRSQPWVFTDSLLLGFFADLDGPDCITLQEDELSEGAWFDRAHLPDVPPGGSLTGEMIELFRQGREP